MFDVFPWKSLKPGRLKLDAQGFSAKCDTTSVIGSGVMQQASLAALFEQARSVGNKKTVSMATKRSIKVTVGHMSVRIGNAVFDSLIKSFQIFFKLKWNFLLKSFIHNTKRL